MGRDAKKRERYAAIDPNIAAEQVTNTMEGPMVRRLLKEFVRYKKTFSNASRDVKFELPRPDPLPVPEPEPLDIPGRVDQGLLTITKYFSQESGKPNQY